MTSGAPNWQKVSGELIKRNNEMRKELGLELRDPEALNFQRIVQEVAEENRMLADELKKMKEEKKVQEKERSQPVEEQFNAQCDICEEVFSAKTEAAVKAKVTRHNQVKHNADVVESSDEEEV